MICDVCGSNESIIKDYTDTFNVKGKLITIKAKRRFCKKCNNYVYDEELDNAISKQILENYNHLYGIDPDKIIFLRKKYRLSQEQFSKVIGCAKKTLISYEKGTSIPNDNYMRILNSLISKPELINDIVVSNKQEFSDQEYNTITKKVIDFSKNNINQFYSYKENKLSQYNGFTIFNKDKVYNIIKYLSDNGGVLKVKLLKEMFYADFCFYKEYGCSITGLEYAKLPFGPVPDDYEEILHNAARKGQIEYTIEMQNDYEYDLIKANQNYDSKLFNADELKLLTQIKNKFKGFNSKEIADYSHKEKAYIEAKKYGKIDYSYAFDINLDRIKE